MNNEKREGFAGVVSFLKEARKNRIWRYVTSVLAVFVVFVTAYVLILPGVALSSSELSPSLGIENITVTNAAYDGTEYTASFYVTLSDITVSDIDSDTTYYVLFPEGVSLTAYSGSTMTGKDSNGKDAFTYTYAYTDDGILYASVNFIKSYLDSAGTKLTGGFFQYTAEISSDNLDENYNLVIKNGTTTYTVSASSINVTTDNSNPAGDLIVSKSASEYDVSTNSITYTVTVKSTKGTQGDISLTDTITSELGISDVAISSVTLRTKDQWGNISSSSDASASLLSESYSNNVLSATLSALTSGDGYGSEYVITYTVSLADISDYSISKVVSNSATASAKTKWTGSGDGTVTSTAAKEVTVKYNMLSKTGTVDSDGNITWVITVNADKMNIYGMTLSDEMFSSLDESTLASAISGGSQGSDYSIITDNTTGKITGITFIDTTGSQSNTKTYTITYTTGSSAAWASGEAVTTNTATLSGGGLGTDITTSENVTTKSGGVSKTKDSVSYNTDNTLDITWTTTATIPSGGITLGTILYDYLGGSSGYTTKTTQWMTFSQADALRQKLYSINLTNNGSTISTLDYGSDYTVQFYSVGDSNGSGTTGWIEMSSLTDSNTYGEYYFTAFRINFTKTITVSNSCTFSLTYTTTADRSSLDGSSVSSLNYKNNVEVQGTSTLKDEASHTEYAYVIKTDGNGNSGSTNTTVGSDGALTWIVKAYVPAGSTDTSYTITDTLPENVTLTSAKVAVSWKSCTLTSASLTGDINGGTVEMAIDSSGSQQIVTISIPSASYSELLANGEYITVTYNCKVADSLLVTTDANNTTVELESGASVGTFSNSVTVKTSSNATFGTTSQSQTVTYSTSGGTSGTEEVSKEYVWNSDASILTYTVIINPEGETLANGDNLSFEDILTANHATTWGVYAELVTGSVKFYKAVSDGNGGYTKGDELSIAWTYDQSFYTGYVDYISVYHTITSVSVPDATPILLEYQYEVWLDPYDAALAAAGTHYGIGGIGNKMTLQGMYVDSTGTSNADYYSNSHFSAGIASTENTITLVKVDSENYATQLSGATYTLYKWSGSEWTSIGTYITDTNGKISIGTSTLGSDYATDTGYKLVETAAPSGYAVDSSTEFYFYWSGNGTDCYPSNWDSSVAHNLTKASATEYAENSKKPEDTTTSVSVTKSWVQLAGSTTTIPDEVTVDLYRYEDTSASSGASSSSALTISVIGNYNNQEPLTATLGEGFTLNVDAGSDTITWYYINVYDKGDEYNYTQLVYNGSYNQSILSFDITDAQAGGNITFGYGTSGGTAATVTVSNPAAVVTTGSYTASELPSGTKVGTYTITKSAAWTLTIDDLTYESYDENGVKHTYLYYFVEQSVAGYEATYSLDVGVNEGGSITITNTEQDGTYTYTEAAVTKTWANSDTTSTDDISSYYKSATFTLYRVTGTDLTTATKVGEIILDGVVDTEETTAWSYTWSNLVKSYTPKGATDPSITYTYYVAETATELASNATLTGTTYQSGGSDITASSLTVGTDTVSAYAYGNSVTVIAVANTITITTTPNEPVQTKVNLTVDKAWTYVGCTESDVSGRSVTLGLYRISDASGAALEQVKTVTLDGVVDTEETTAWSYTWSDLLYTSTVNNVTTTYTYYIGEVSSGVTGGEVVEVAWNANVDTSSGSSKTYSDGNSSITVYPITGVSASATVQITLTNTVSAYKSIGITKKWINSSGTEISPASAEATFTLLRLLKKDSGYVTGADSKVVVDAQTLTLDSSNWSGSWTDLPTAVEYNGTVYECAYFVVETGVTNNGAAVDLSKYAITYTDANSNTISTTYNYADAEYYQVTNGSSVTVTNTSTEKSVVLPLTGGLGGSGRLVLLGSGIVLLAVSMIVARRRRWRGVPEKC